MNLNAIEIETDEQIYQIIFYNRDLCMLICVLGLQNICSNHCSNMYYENSFQNQKKIKLTHIHILINRIKPISDARFTIKRVILCQKVCMSLISFSFYINFRIRMWPKCSLPLYHLFTWKHNGEPLMQDISKRTKISSTIALPTDIFVSSLWSANRSSWWVT